jgi:hypothetical protein
LASDVFPTTYLQHSGRGFDVGTVQVLDVDRIRFRHLGTLLPQNEMLLTHFYPLIIDMMSGTDTEEVTTRART